MGIESEYIAAVETMNAADFSHLEHIGCRREIVGGLLLELPPVGKLRAQTFKDGSWQPSNMGHPYHVSPTIDGDELTDIVAWSLSIPSKTFTRTGIGALIGADAISAARWNDEPVFAFTDPLEWLRGDCRGIAPLRYDAGLALALGCVDIIAQTPALARRIKSACAIPQPKISFVKLREAA